MIRVPVTLPDLGATGQPMQLSAWFVDVGDEVTLGESLAGILVPGITCDVPAPVSGRVVQIDMDLDDPVRPGDVLAWIESADDEDEDQPES